MPSKNQSKLKYEKAMKEKEEKQRKAKGKNCVQTPTESTCQENISKPIEKIPEIRTFFATLSQESEITETVLLDLDAWMEEFKEDNQEADCEKTKQSYSVFLLTMNNIRFVFFKLRKESHFNKVSFKNKESFPGIAHFRIIGDIPRTYKKSPTNYIKALAGHIAQNSLEEIMNCEIVYQHEAQGMAFLENFKTHFKIIETRKEHPYQLEEISSCKILHEKDVSDKNSERKTSLPSTEDSEMGNSESEKESENQSSQQAKTDEDTEKVVPPENDVGTELNNNNEWSEPLTKGKRKRGNKKKQILPLTVVQGKSKGASETTVRNKESKSKNYGSFVPSDNGKPLGLPNIGNTCYMNSALQNFFETPELGTWFCDEKNKESFKDGGLAHKLTALWELKKVAHNADILQEEIHAFKQSISSLNPDFDDNNQHDALELFKILLGGLSEELNTAKGRNVYRMLSFNPEISDEENAEEYFKYMRERETSIITSTFGGQLINITRCKVCEKEKKTCDEYWSLPLCFKQQEQTPVDKPENFKTSRGKGKNKLNKRNNQHNRVKETVKLEDILKHFTDSEDIQAKLFCDVCENDQDHTTASKILRLPNILVIAIKRFRQTNRGFVKENASISFPIKELDLKEFTQGGHESLNDTKYDLFGLINHSGNLNSGHYTAECIDRKDKCWYKFDDANVRKIEDKSREPSSDVYMLFYAKSSCLNK